MGLCGNARASRVWKGEGEEIEQLLAYPFNVDRPFCLMGVDKNLQKWKLYNRLKSDGRSKIQLFRRIS
jgi:hypothetical protein